MVDILAIGAHPDDVEISVGGTLIKMRKLGHSIAICHCSDGEPTPNGNRETRLQEAAYAAKRLGAELEILDLPNRYITDTIEGRVKIANVIRKHQPKILLSPYPGGAHPDHRIVSQLVDAARFTAKLTKYDQNGQPWEMEPYWCPTQFHFSLGVRAEEAIPSFIVDVGDEYEEKMEVLRCYRSQFNVDMRFLGGTDFWGPWIGKSYGEPFWAHKAIGIKDLFDVTVRDR